MEKREFTIKMTEVEHTFLQVINLLVMARKSIETESTNLANEIDKEIESLGDLLIATMNK